MPPCLQFDYLLKGCGPSLKVNYLYLLCLAHKSSIPTSFVFIIFCSVQLLNPPAIKPLWQRFAKYGPQCFYVRMSQETLTNADSWVHFKLVESGNLGAAPGNLRFKQVCQMILNTYKIWKKMLSEHLLPKLAPSHSVCADGFLDPRQDLPFFCIIVHLVRFGALPQPIKICWVLYSAIYDFMTTTHGLRPKILMSQH